MFQKSAVQSLLSVSVIALSFFPISVFAQADTDVATGSGQCTCTCDFQTPRGPESQAIPSIPGEGVTFAESREQCQTVCENERTRRGGSSVRAAYGSCAAGTFRSAGSGSEPGTDLGSTESSGGTEDSGSVPLYNPLGSDIGVAEFISRGIRTVIGFIGALALLMFVYGGVTWMTAGDSKRVDTAKEILKNSTIGLLLIFFSYSLVSIVFSLLGSS